MPATQYAYRQYAGNGSTTTFAVPFPYLLKAHVKVYTGYDLASGAYTSLLVDGTNYTWTSATQIQTTTAPAAGVTLTVIRQTPSTTQLVQWQDGSNLIASDIDTADKQNLYVVQEQLDRTEAIATQSASAKTSADSALATVNNALPYTSIATVAAIPSSPADGTRIEVLNTTGIESFSPLSGRPAGLVGSSAIKARMIYSASGASWSWVDYSLNDSLNYFVQQVNVSSSTTSTSTTTVANSLAVKTTKDVADAALPKSGGSMTGVIAFAAGQPTATTSSPGIVLLTDSTSSTSTTTAATPNSVKTASDTAAAALPKSGGTMTGAIAFAAGQPTATTSTAGIVQLTDSIASTSVTTAATPNSVKTASDLALPKAGGTMTGDIAFTATQTYPKVPQNAKTSAYTLIATDAGKHIAITTGGVTVPSGIFSAGDAITVFNNSASNQSLVQSAGTTLRWAGTALTGSRTLAQYGLATVMCVSSNVFVVSGAGLS